MKEAIDKLLSCDDMNAVILYRLDSSKEKSKSKGKRKIDKEDERPKKAKGIHITGSSSKYGLLKHTRKICPKYLVSSQKGILLRCTLNPVLWLILLILGS